jgi:hypothetical protein
MACKICHKKDTTTSLGHSEVLSVPNDPGHTGSYSQYGPSIFPAPGRRSNNMKVWFFNFEKRLEDDPEVFAWPLFSCLGVPPAGESAGHVLPDTKSRSNMDICPSIRLIRLPHFPDHADLLRKQAGTGTG